MKNSIKIDVIYDFKHEASDELAKCGTVHVRVYDNRKRTYVSTGVRVLPSEWNDDLWVIRRNDAAALNKMIREQLDKCRSMVGESVNHRGPSLQRVPDSNKMKVDRTDASFLDWLYKQMEIGEMAEGTRRHHFKVWRSLCSYGRMRRFEDVRPERVDEWLDMVGSRTVKDVVDGRVVVKAIAQTTKRDYYKVLKKWVAIGQDRCLISDDALKGVKCARGKSKPRVVLSEDELQALMDVELSMPSMIETRDRFLVECGTGFAYNDFMRADFSKLEKVGKYWTYTEQRGKTDEEFVVVVLPWAYEILKRYGFVMPKISNQKYNAYLKVVCDAAGIKKHVTTHVARHTYATFLLNNGVRLEAIQRVLGHASIKTTQIYARANKQTIVSAFDTIKSKLI